MDPVLKEVFHFWFLVGEKVTVGVCSGGGSELRSREAGTRRERDLCVRPDSTSVSSARSGVGCTYVSVTVTSWCSAF